MITNKMIKDVLNKADAGEQFIPIDLNTKDVDLAMTVAPVKYNGKECYVFGIDVMGTATGESIDIDGWIILGKDLVHGIVDELEEGALDEIVNEIKARIFEEESKEEQVPAE